MKRACWTLSCLAACALPAAAERLADWQVYQQGPALELSIDRNAIWQTPDGLAHFVNQERFTQRQYDKHYQVYFWIRRTTGYVDCKQYQYVLVSTDFYTDANRHVWSTMYPLPRYAWKWQPVYQDTLAAAMIDLVCSNPASRKKPE
jgi:hypothetical protein